MKISCKHCGTNTVETVIPRYEVPKLGIPVALINSVKLVTCPKCGESEYLIPDLCKLIEAAATSRILDSKQLSATEIRFLRKSLGLTSAELATILGTTLETVSRWENGKLTNMSTSTEKLIRLLALNKLERDASHAKTFSKQIITMDIERHKDEPVPIKLEIQLAPIGVQNAERIIHKKRKQKIISANRGRTELRSLG